MQGISAKLIEQLTELAEAAEEDGIRPPSLLVIMELTKLCMVLDFPPEWMSIWPSKNNEFIFSLRNIDNPEKPSFVLRINQLGEFLEAAEASSNHGAKVGTDLESIVMTVDRLS